jgi:hypothetical protein
VPFKGKKEADRHMLVVAGDDCCVVLYQSGHCSVGEGDLAVVKDYETDVLDGYGGLLFRLIVVRLQLDH